jgi:hypothetical protein
MSISTMDQAVAGACAPIIFNKTAPGTPVVGSLYSLWMGTTGYPLLGTIPTGNKSGQFYTSAITMPAGGLWVPQPTAGDTTNLYRFQASSQTTGTLLLADRIWSDSLSPVGIGAQLIFSGSFPRSRGTGGGDSSGKGIMLAIEVYTALGASAATPKVTYVDQNGIGDTGVAIMAVPATAAAGTFIPIYQSIGRRGFRSVHSYNNMTTKTSGVLGLTAFRILARVGVSYAGVVNAIDLLTGGFPQIYDNTVPFFIWMAGTTTAPQVFGQVIWAQG